jgi:predicted GNAT superfamily acetyltransferase
LTAMTAVGSLDVLVMCKNKKNKYLATNVMWGKRHENFSVLFYIDVSFVDFKKMNLPCGFAWRVH